MENGLRLDTVALDDEQSALVLIDQTRLPGETVVLYLKEQAEIRDAIYQLKVRGAPAIGVAAAIGLYLAAKQIDTDDEAAFFRRLHEAKTNLASARPTAVNLFWALDRMERTALSHSGASTAGLKRLLLDEARAIWNEDVQTCRKIGENGLTLLRDGDGILTHCNAGRLATVRYGTALAPVHVGKERGYRFHVYTDETRPLLQGARLSAFELCADGIETTVICDNMASQVMKNGWVQAVLVGADRIAANGDACNKIGTSGVAILARYYGVPFYVCAPLSTIDISLVHGGLIPIEQRPGSEVTEMWYQKPMAPKEAEVFNPAFDVTDHSLITAIVTECGILRPPFDDGIRALLDPGKKPAAQA